MTDAGASTETPLARARGLGTAREGGAHWGGERAVALAAFALAVWLAVSLFRLPALDQQTLTDWLRNPLAAVPMLLFALALFRHLQLGLVVIVEDYVHEEGNRLICLALIHGLSLLAGALAVFSILKIALGGSTG